MNSIRYCPVCEKNRNFVYDPTVRHSCCKDCGARFASNPKDEKIDRSYLLEMLTQRIAALSNCRNGENNKVITIRIKEIKKLIEFVKR